jgi:hypothetical protein
MPSARSVSGVARAFSQQPVVELGSAPPPPNAWYVAAPHCELQQRSPVKTTHDTIGHEVLAYLQGGGGGAAAAHVPINDGDGGLQYMHVSQRLLKRIDAAAATAADEASGVRPSFFDSSSSDISRLLLASSSGVSTGVSMGSLAAQIQMLPSAMQHQHQHERQQQQQQQRRERYLPRRNHHDVGGAAVAAAAEVDLDALLRNAEQYAASISTERREESSEPVYVKGLDARLKVPHYCTRLRCALVVVLFACDL